MAVSRNLRARALAAPLLLVAVFGTAALAAPPTVVGVTAAIVNDVRIKGAAARQFAKAALRQRVALADQVQTGTSSRLQLLLLDQSKFTVGPNARLTIDRFVYDPSGGSLSASVAKGAFRFMSGKSSPSKQATINSPSASIGIRGTLLDGAVGQLAVDIARGERDLRGNLRHDPATATLVVLRGPGPRRQGNDRVGAIDVTGGGKTVTLDRPLQAAYVPHAGATPITFTISSPGLARLNDLLFEPQSVLYDPNAAPFIPPPGSDGPNYDSYDRPPPPPPGMLDGGPRFNGGGYIPSIPNLNGYRGNVPPPRDRPTNQRGQNQSTVPGTSPPPPATNNNNSVTTQPPPNQQGTRLYLPEDKPSPPPPTGDTPQSSVPTGNPATGGGYTRPGRTRSVAPPPTTGVTGNQPPPSDPTGSAGDPTGLRTPQTDPGGSLKPTGSPGRPGRPSRNQDLVPTGKPTYDQPVKDPTGAPPPQAEAGGPFKPTGSSGKPGKPAHTGDIVPASKPTFGQPVNAPPGAPPTQADAGGPIKPPGSSGKPGKGSTSPPPTQADPYGPTGPTVSLGKPDRPTRTGGFAPTGKPVATQPGKGSTSPPPTQADADGSLEPIGTAKPAGKPVLKRAGRSPGRSPGKPPQVVR